MNVFVKTYGCQMNLRDSEVISGLLASCDFQLTAHEDEADVILYNTCSVRQHAEDKVWSEIGRIGKSRKGKSPLIGLIGCMAQNYKESVFDRSKDVDFVVGPQDIAKIPHIIKDLLQDSGMYERKIWETDSQARPEEIYHTGFFHDKDRAFIVISEGCSNFCTYCVVPYTRGPLRNRSAGSIIEEIKSALDTGITNITLLGQNVNAYSSEGVDFISLLGLVDALPGIKEFSFLTSHPKDTTEDLFKAMAGCQKLKRFLHLPAQSGSDRILQLMNRTYTRAHYIELAQQYRKIVPGGALSTDIIVGFPSESDDDFQGTVSLVKDIAFDSAYIFKYSPRPHASASSMLDDVVKEKKERRHAIILTLQKEISRRKKEHGHNV
ncbi:MAG TPA: tRNA (N6-isopentenyl adenosine(37)-C2)-methylthiotransferase MiaB [Candidatus Omnitrophota bacterium]|nr:tRNA (N6-isopentenyl adenosine(37)-C2)-methylthiotransferase MiaB [Candidatus Omnitrophota bacterium]HPT07693.1 tRNA (N6-isopentenyl adenosine(37)-C2)-methylthiotransferase MiaB [Candidatus Omnitrophota bacterium]